MGSEITAAVISDKIGQVRRDPFAMLPFIGYNVGDYLQHWIDIGEKGDADKLPKLFYVNWFRRDEDGNFQWPGFGDNSRVLKWIVERCAGDVDARETAIGYMPSKDDLYLEGLDINDADMDEILEVDVEGWKAEAESVREHYKDLDARGGKLPQELYKQLDALVERLEQA